MALKDDCIAAYGTAQTEDTADWDLLRQAIDNNIQVFDDEVTRQAGLGQQSAVIGNVIKMATEKNNKKPGNGKKFDKGREGQLRSKFELTALQYLQAHFEAEGLVCAIERGKKLIVSGWVA